MIERVPQLRKILPKPKYQTEETLKLQGIKPDQIKQLIDVRQRYPYVEMFDSGELNRLEFIKWRVNNDNLTRPDNFESILVKDKEYLLTPQPFIFMPEFDLTQENDVVTMSELLSNAAQNTVKHLEKENIKPIPLNNGDELIRKVFKTYKGRATIAYNKTNSPSNRSLNIKLEELLYSDELEPVLYTPIEGKIHLDSSKFMISVKPEPSDISVTKSSKYENYLDRGSIININEFTHDGASTMAEIMHLYENNLITPDESL